MQLLRYKILPLLFVLLLLFLQYQLWFNTDGIIDMRRLKKHLELQIEENKKLKKRNEDLLHQIQALRTNEDAMEGHARQELGMIKKGETFYQVVQ